MSKFSFEVIDTLAVLSEGSKGWQKKLTLVSWNGHAPKYDIRDWSEDNTKMGKGVTFNANELKELKQALNDIADLD